MSFRSGEEMGDDYFAKLELEKLEKLRIKIKSDNAASHREAAKELHYHRCGKCGDAMETKIWRGVEIEVCPDCGAILLDKGELETLSGSDESGVISGILSLFQPR